MSRSVNINWELLQALVKLKTQPRLSLLRVADQCLVTAICECALNILNGNIPLSESVKYRLSKEKSVVRVLARKNSSWKSKRQLIWQKGEKLIPLIISIALKHLENESRQENGPHFSRRPTEIEYTSSR